MKEYYEKYWKGELKIGKGVMEDYPKHDDKKNIERFLPFLKGRCLDVGCGEGFYANEFSKHCKVIGIDISEEAIRKARKRFPSLHFTPAVIENLPFEKESFDCVTAIEVIEHIPNTELMFKELNRVTKKGGFLIITTPQLTRLKLIFISLFMFPKYFYPTNPHLRFYSSKTLADVLKDNGFELVYYEMDNSFFDLIPKGMFVVAKKIVG